MSPDAQYWIGQVILASGVLLVIRVGIVGPILRELRRQTAALGDLETALRDVEDGLDRVYDEANSRV